MFALHEFLVLVYFNIFCIVLGIWLYIFAKLAYYKIKPFFNRLRFPIKQRSVRLRRR